MPGGRNYGRDETLPRLPALYQYPSGTSDPVGEVSSQKPLNLLKLTFAIKRKDIWLL